MKRYLKSSNILSDSVTPSEYVNKLKSRRNSKKQLAEEIKSMLSPDMSSTDQLEVYFKYLVPSSGPAKSLAGELVRAMMRILYRDYNDGDLWYSGYGKETCGPSVLFLCDNIPSLERDFQEIADQGMEDDQYTNALENITSKLIVYLNEHPESFMKKTSDSRNHEGELSDVFYLPRYEFDVDASYDDSYYEVDDDDIDDFIENIIDSELSSGSVNRWARDGWTIEELEKEDYDYLENNWSRWFRDFLEDYVKEEEYDDED